DPAPRQARRRRVGGPKGGSGGAPGGHRARKASVNRSFLPGKRFHRVFFSTRLAPKQAREPRQPAPAVGREAMRATLAAGHALHFDDQGSAKAASGAPALVFANS